MSHRVLHRFFIQAAQRYPEHVAVIEPDAGSVTYRELAELSDRVRDCLHSHGIRSGDRVGICMRKSIDAVAIIYGILKAGAVYVPVDSGAPPPRNAFVMHNCAVALVFTEQRLEPQLRSELRQLNAAPRLFVIPQVGGGKGLEQALSQAGGAYPETETITPEPGELAYILYTSGSTGKPKGVMLTHENAVSFIDWCSNTFEPTDTDRYSSHAPFHFDLSILDIYLPLKHGASLVLVAEDIGKDPIRLAPLIAQQKITCWY